MSKNNHTVKTALFMNMGIFGIKTVAAICTNSASMAAEAVHSLADTGNQVLLMLGMKRSKRKADATHPFGHGKEEYFWSFIVAMLLFVLGSVYSLYEGTHKLMHPEAIHHAYYNLGILGAAFLMEGFSWLVARRAIGGTTSGLLKEIINSKDSATVVVFVEDTGALLGLGIAFVGTAASFLTGNPVYDAMASVGIGVLLLVIAAFLANEMRKLMIGEAVDPVTVRYVRRVINSHEGVKAVGKIKTMQLGNESCIVAVDVDFNDSLHDHELESIMHSLKSKIRATIPTAEHIFIQLQKIPVKAGR